MMLFHLVPTGLTGVKLNAADLIHNDLATHYITRCVFVYYTVKY